ncbi:TraR/DksA family transcriptional regulator [Nitratidesulfovibrio sp. 1201_IL3209]|uniref:TraR/DksA family transcriptional regulator n=1 Tax=Nitratidesulfovibrio sp. 1201_IL3209 TaxID=3084053 RepID=UPI002FD8F9F9
MPDIFDQATAIEEMDRPAAIARAAGRSGWSGPDPVWIDGVACCAECGDAIPQARRAALPGVGVCAACASEGERA